MLYKKRKNWEDPGVIINLSFPEESHILDECFNPILKNQQQRFLSQSTYKEIFENLCKINPDFKKTSETFKSVLHGSIEYAWNNHLVYSKENSKEITYPKFCEIWKSVCSHFKIATKLALIGQKEKINDNDLIILLTYESFIDKVDSVLKEKGLIRTETDNTIPEKFTLNFLLKSS